jgi:hypothetical protein
MKFHHQGFGTCLELKSNLVSLLYKFFLYFLYFEHQQQQHHHHQMCFGYSTVDGKLAMVLVLFHIYSTIFDKRPSPGLPGFDGVLFVFWKRKDEEECRWTLLLKLICAVNEERALARG